MMPYPPRIQRVSVDGRGLYPEHAAGGQTGFGGRICGNSVLCGAGPAADLERFSEEVFERCG